MPEAWLERITPIDPASPIPLYYQVESDLRRLIAAEVLGPGVTIPAEHDLCATYGVSRHTMRTALSRLVADNLIARSAGRGTVVCTPEARIPFSLDRSFSRQIAELGQAARSIVLGQAAGRVGAGHPEALHAAAGRPCLDLLRLRLGDEDPIGIQQTTVLTERCAGLETFDFTDASLYEVLAGHFRLDIQKIHHTIAAASADAEQAERLDVAPGTPLLVVRTTAYLHDDAVIEHTVSHYRSDRYEYAITHTQE
ncbi:MAG: GntR family transcriptional regulator [Rhodothermales bacterium]